VGALSAVATGGLFPQFTGAGTFSVVVYSNFPYYFAFALSPMAPTPLSGTGSLAASGAFPYTFASAPQPTTLPYQLPWALARSDGLPYTLPWGLTQSYSFPLQYQQGLPYTLGFALQPQPQLPYVLPFRVGLAPASGPQPLTAAPGFAGTGALSVTVVPVFNPQAVNIPGMGALSAIAAGSLPSQIPFICA
jgi:hypothetical protein